MLTMQGASFIIDVFGRQFAGLTKSCIFGQNFTIRATANKRETEHKPDADDKYVADCQLIINYTAIHAN